MRIVWDAGVRGSHLKDKRGKSCDRNILQKVKVSDIIEIMKSLNEDLKTGQFSQIYLLYGEENYLKKQYKERFVKAMLPQGDTMNYAYYEGKGVEIREVIDLAETLPFFAERRLIVFENTGLFKSSGADLAEYIKTMPETTYFIFVEEEVDKRSKLYKAVKPKGHIVELPFQDESTLSVGSLASQAGRKTDIGASSVFSGKSRNRYAEYPGRTGKTVLLYTASGRDHTGGHRCSLYQPDRKSYF